MIKVDDLTVRFGGVVSLNSMTAEFPGGTCGLIGPNGAGKTTFFNVLSGFVTPFSGRVTIDGTDLLSMPDFKRARWGLRRTFQTEQAIENLTVFENVATVYEHSGSGTRTGRTTAVMEALEFVGLAEVAQETVRALRAKERRFIEVARAVVGTPKAVLLPERTGATVILVDHDMALVQACCAYTAVLDFGRLIAAGPTSEVLRTEQVMQAYLGVDDHG
jgi:branched-chain amino acid transport system ATP-binding protein